MVKNKYGNWNLDSDVCNTNTSQKHNFQQPSSNLSLHKKWVYLIGIKVFNSLPQSTKNLTDNPKKFTSALRNYMRIPSTLEMNTLT